MEFLATLCLLALSFVGSLALPTDLNAQNDLKSDLKYASQLSQLIATNLLKDNMEIDGNNAYSPLGVATTLAILAEASDGETYNEFIAALNSPKAKADLRQSFKRILRNFQTPVTESPQSPSFKTWLYIYRNYTARDEFKQILANNYCVEVKDINRSEYDWDVPSTSLDESLELSSTSNSKDVIGFETLKKLNIDEQQDEEEIANIEANKEASKFDKFVDDKQYVEAPLIREEIGREKLQQQEQQQQQQEQQQQQLEGDAEELSTTVSDDAMINDMLEVDESAKASPTESKRDEEINVQENETVQDEEKIDAIRKNYAGVEEIQPSPPQESNEPQKVTIPLQKLVDGGSEIMQALESHFTSRRLSGARSLFRKDDIASALSANSITGKEAGSRTKMLLFNGLYYRGNWAYPFQELRSGPNEIFHLTSDQSLQTPMMHARGKYLVADLEALNACAVSFPYENRRYSLLVVMPKDIDGLHKLLENLNPDIFATMKGLFKEREIYISLPKFQVEETSRSESMLKGLGLVKIFNRDTAQLSQLSDDPDLHVDEIVQFVNVRVDEGGSSENVLSASSSVGARIMDDSVELKVEVNRPFLYFVWDNEEEFVIVSGKITAPEFKEDLGVDLEIEYTQS